MLSIVIKETIALLATSNEYKHICSVCLYNKNYSKTMSLILHALYIIIIMTIMLHDIHTQNTPVKCARRNSVYSEDEYVNTYYYSIASLYTIQRNIFFLLEY